MFTRLLLALVTLTAQQHAPQLADSYRKDQDGWVYLHLRGRPYDIGYQYGSLAAAEIDGANKALKIYLPESSGEDWKFYREKAMAILWPKVPAEYKQEIKGMAAGIEAKGYKLDVADICAQNGFFELAWYYVPYLKSKQQGLLQSGAPLQCSAFIATGSWTKDGRPVMAHNAWIDYMLGEHFNLILDIKPDKGHEFMMDSFAGFIDSGSDFAVNTAGIMFTETTIAGFEGFSEKGMPEFVRAREAIQYSDSLDDVKRHLSDDNNGGYANTWLMADNKTNEIGELELGLLNVTFKRKKDGYFVGANFPQNPKLIKQECDPRDWPNQVCIDRHVRWDDLMAQNKGQIDLEKAEAFESDHYDEDQHRTVASATTLCSHADEDPRKGFSPTDFDPFGACQAKAITAALADRMSLWGRMGHPCGEPFDAKKFLAAHPAYNWQAPVLKDMPTEPWSMFSAGQ